MSVHVYNTRLHFVGLAENPLPYKILSSAVMQLKIIHCIVKWKSFALYDL